MKNGYWIAVVAVGLIVGIFVGYGLWGSTAGTLPEVEKERAAAQAQVAEMKKKLADLEANLGRVTSEKLNLEKENAELKETLARAAKKKR